MGRQQLIVLAVAIISALLGTAFLSGRLGADKYIQGVAIAQTDIEANVFIEPKDIIRGVADAKIYTPSLLFRPESVIGKITRVAIQEGELITAGKVFSGTSGIQHVIPTGHRAMSIPINQPTRELKVFKPGGRIDIIATIQQQGQVRTGTILEDALLLAKEGGTGKDKGISFVIAVKPREAEKLALAVRHGEMRVGLRRVGDSSTLENSGVGLNDLVKGLSKVPARAIDLPLPNSMEIIRGTSRTTDYFEQDQLSKASARFIKNN